MAFRLKAGEPVSRAVVRIVLEELQSSARRLSRKNRRNWDTPIHEARKSVKKIRALLRLMRSELGTAFQPENRRFRDLGRRLSRFRESAAAIETFDELIAQHPRKLGQEIRTPMRRVLVQQKFECERRNGIDRTVGIAAAEFRNVKVRVMQWPLQRDGFAAIEPGLVKTFRQGRRALALVRKRPYAENYHEWRKRVKDHWYQVRLLVDHAADSMQRYLNKLHRLETWLGDEHNLTLLLKKIELHPNHYGAAQSTERFLQVARNYQKRLQKKSRSLGERIYDEKTSRFTGRMKRAWNGRVSHIDHCGTSRSGMGFP